MPVFRLRWRPVVLALPLIFCPALLWTHPSRTDRDGKILAIQQLIENQDLAEASQLLEQSAKEFPADPGFDNLRGIIAAQQGNLTYAERNFAQAIQRAPRFTAAYLNLGRLYQLNFPGDPEAQTKALDIYRKVLGYSPKNIEANYQAAVLQLEQGKYKDSLNLLSRLPENLRSHAQQLSVACADYAALGDRAHADKISSELLGSPEFSEADALEMLPALQAGKRDDLIESIFGVLGKRTKLSAPSFRALGAAAEHLGNLTEARGAFEMFVGEGNLSVASLLTLARVAHEQHDYKGSLGYLAHARDLDPGNARVDYFFGLVCLDLDLIAEARNSFEKAVQLEPENASYNYLMGVTSVFRHDPAEAVPYFEKYLALKPQDSHGRLALGVAYFRAKDYDAALPWLTKAAESPATASTAHYYLGALAIEQGRLDEARDHLELAIKANSDYADALAELGHYYLLKKAYDQADKYLSRALRADPHHLSANFYLLTLYARTADPRRDAQAKRYDDLQKLQEEKSLEVMRLIQVRPFETSQP